MGGFLDNLLGTITGGLLPSHDQRVANNASNAAGDLAGQQAGQFSSLYGTGGNVFNTGNNALSGLGQNPLLQLLQTGTSNNPLLQQYGQASGVNIPGYSAPPGYIPGTPGGGYSTAANGQPGAPSVQRPTGETPGGMPVSGSTSPAQPSNGVQPTSAPVSPMQQRFDSYGLTQPQQVQLNQQLNVLTQKAQSQASQYQAAMQQRGVDPALTAEGAARINAEFSNLQEQTIAGFAEQARKAKEDALQTLIQLGTGAYGQQQQYGQNQEQLGLNTQMGATSGLSNPQAAQQSIAQNAQASQDAVTNLVLGTIANLIPGLGGVGAVAGAAGRTPPIVNPPANGGYSGLGSSGQGF